MSRNTQQQLVHFLSDMYSVEQQALVQMNAAPDIAGDDGLAAKFRMHQMETETHADLLHQRLEALGGSPSHIKDAVMKLGGKGFLLFAKIQPETPGRLVAHAYAYEAMEWAGYEVLGRIAELAGDTQTHAIAHRIQTQESAMLNSLEAGFDDAEHAAHRLLASNEMREDLCRHLSEAHALEHQSCRLLEKSKEIAGDAKLARLYADHLIETKEHTRRIERRLEELDSKPSSLMDTALGIGALNWGLFFQAQSDTPSKLAIFAFAMEHLEIAGYELLRRTADRSGDTTTSAMCEAILTEERAMADRINQHLNLAVRATLHAVSA